MRYRALDDAGDMQFGHSLRDYYQDSPAAVAQAVKTRLGLFLGEWLLDNTDGTPWLTDVLGKYTDKTRTLTLRERIYETPGVIEITKFYISFNANTRVFLLEATITTLYGVTSLSVTRNA
jgi:hypothetical protein